MLFNSREFLFFFIAVTTAYFLLPARVRWVLLLAASVYFYMAFVPAYILILLITIIIDYAAGIFIERELSERKRKAYLWISILATCAVLFVFKYFGFFAVNANALADFIGWNYSIETLKFLLPIGLSFHTFQSLSYVIEVYRRNQRAERHFGIYALYVMFYPQLVAGPIERPQNLLHQFREEHRFDAARVLDGLKLMLWGLFKKAVIADRLSILVNQVYADPSGWSGPTLVAATVFFAFQIYCDFSGYADMAIGSAQVMGFRLMDNFNRPYFSKSVPEFWKRWHISLSTWFRDYIYLPLGGNRVPRFRYFSNVMIVFLISGLWHGANWTFIVWGALHGAYMILSRATGSLRHSVSSALGLTRHPLTERYVRIGITFSLVSFAWIFFRAESLADAFGIIGNLWTGWGSVFTLEGIKATVGSWNLKGVGLLTALAGLLVMESVHLIQRHGKMRQFLSERPLWIQRALLYGLLLVTYYFGVFDYQEFIYFQF